MKDSFLFERFRVNSSKKVRTKYNQSLNTIYEMIYSIMYRVNDNYNRVYLHKIN